LPPQRPYYRHKRSTMTTTAAATVDTMVVTAITMAVIEEVAEAVVACSSARCWVL
jgi:hypothetical protein